MIFGLKTIIYKFYMDTHGYVFSWVYEVPRQHRLKMVIMIFGLKTIIYKFYMDTH
jgi:hypothetical protein